MNQDFYWCLTHHKVERLEERCAGDRVLGPYDSREAAEEALAKVGERNKDWDAEDRAWEGDDEDPAPA